MRRVAAILLFICLLAQTMAYYGVIGYYRANRAYIAENLCENRAKPELKCCGKCYLRKQLKKVDNESSPSKNQPKKSEKSAETWVCIFPSVSTAPVAFAAITAITHTPVLQHLHDGGIPAGIFHPPAPIA